MQSGRITPIFRQFFPNAVASRRQADADAGGQQSREQPSRQPTKEEAEAALAALLAQEEFQQKNLSAELNFLEGIFVITVIDSGGSVLRAIRGPEILRVLEASAALGDKTQHLGRILDRRI